MIDGGHHMQNKSIYKVLNNCNLRKGDLVFDIGVGTLKLLSYCASITECNVYGNEIDSQFQMILKHYDEPSQSFSSDKTKTVRAVSSNEISGSPSSMDTVDYQSTHNSRLIKKRKIDESNAEDTENEMF